MSTEKEEIVGKTFINNKGLEFVIIDYINSRDVTVKFDDHVVIYNVSYGNIKRGKVNNPYFKNLYGFGYCGIGIHKTSINSKPTKKYSMWKSMLDRCYDDKVQKNRPTYIGCNVSESWNCYQVFGDWYEENYNPEYMQGWHLDKDILVKGKRVYSPETCCFVPNEINILFKTKFEQSKNFKSGIRLTPTLKYNLRCNTQHIGNFNTYEEAKLKCVIFRKQHIKKIADKWKHLITSIVYNAMINFEI